MKAITGTIGAEGNDQEEKKNGAIVVVFFYGFKGEKKRRKVKIACACVAVCGVGSKGSHCVPRGQRKGHAFAAVCVAAFAPSFIDR